VSQRDSSSDERDGAAVSEDGDGTARTVRASELARADADTHRESESRIESWMAEVAAAPNLAPELRAGDRLGDTYRILDELGRGGMGKVYLAHDEVLDRKVAIKLHRVASPQAADALVREARIAASVEHDNIIVVHEVGTWGRYVFVAMEFVDGTTARKWVTEPRGGALPTWREIVALYIKAGRGLAAAHASGLIHRDFKPDNVLVGRDGRVRVADFGLARVRVDEASSEIRRVDARDTTGTDEIRGSPAYMSPEQYRTGNVDARADQFAFCVSLFEALDGRRPFEGDSLPKLAVAIGDGLTRDIAVERAPRHIRAAVRRGLQPDPGARFPDMNALLVELERDPARTRKRAARWIAGIGATAATTWLVTRPPDPAIACVQSPAVAAWWSEPQRGRVAEAFRATADPLAELAFERIDARLAERVTEATAVLVAACEAAHTTGTIARAELDNRKDCLVQREREQSALVELLESRAPEVVERSVAAVEALPPVERCASFGARDLEIPDADRERADALLRSIARVDETREAGLYAQAVSEGEALREAVDAFGHDDIRARLLFALGASYSKIRRPDAAKSTVREALARAIAVDDAGLAAEIALHLVFVDGYLAADVDAGDSWISQSAGWLDRIGRPPDLEVQLLHNRALARRAADRLDESLADAEAALALWESEHREPTVRHASLLAVLGECHRTMGNPELALPILERAAAEYRDMLGPLHPSYGNALNIVGSARMNLADYAGAEADFRHVLEIAASGPRSGKSLVDVRSNLAGVLANTGRLREALDVLEHARQDAIDHAVSSDLRIGVTSNLARMYLIAGNLARAREVVEESLDLARGTAGEDSLMYATALAIRAEVTRTEISRALADIDRALEIQRARLGADAMELANSHRIRALVLARSGRCTDALALIDDVLGRFTATFGEDHAMTVQPRLVLGRCQAELGDAAAALATFERIAAAMPGGRPDEVEPWRIRALVDLGRVDEAREAIAKLRASQQERGRTDVLEELALAVPGGELRPRPRPRAEK
jgi:tetratricopeptide (TPR) repeat protein/predicted Ser/Thr protein kinase